MNTNMKRTRDPQGRDTLLALESNGTRLTERMMQATGALHWLLPDKCLVDAVRVRLPEWPPDVAAWRITQKPICSLTWPGHDVGPVAHYVSTLAGWQPFGPTPWETMA